ncbi:MAG: FHA domain-containing protein [Akkermansiaceae bacterium]|nr:FHA domain-containing protein [Akkermansiaceae bacterium]
MPKINVSAPGSSPDIHEFESDKQTITVGRATSNDITISCESVSTTHCHIVKTDDGYTVHDDDSTNGIKLNGKKQSTIKLTDGIEIHIGDTSVVFNTNEATAASEDTSASSPEIDSDAPSKNSKKCLTAVILLGLIAIAGIAIMPWLGEIGMASEKATTAEGKWLGFLGEFHPVFLHLPIGAFSLVLLMEICRIFTFGKYKPQTTLALAFASGTAVFAAVFGYFLYLSGEFNGDLIEEHKRDGIIFTIVLIVTYLAKYAADVMPRKGLLKPIYGIGVIATTGAMISAGHHGGEITHGDPLKKAPWIEKEEEVLSNKDIADPIVYTQIVHPILEQKCISCHGEKKQKSGLRMDSHAALIEGGDEEEALVPGNLEDSMMIAYLHLPLEDDLRMPPEGKTQLTPEEVQILEWWVKSGASETVRKSELEVTPVIAKALNTLKTPEEIAQEEAALKKFEMERLATTKKVRAGLKEVLSEVNTKFPGSLKYVSQANTDLVFSAVSYRSQFQDTDIDILSGGIGSLTELNLGATQVTDAGMKKLSMFSEIEVLKLSETTITDKGLAELANLKKLRVLNLYGTQVTDQGIKALMGHPTLKKVFLWQTKTTPDGAEELEKSLHESQKSDESEGDENETPESEAQVIIGT